MSDPRYDPSWVASYFDAYGIHEWDRLLRSPADEIRLAIHAHYLNESIPAGSRVLEVGAGAGRFTQILAQIGARVVVTDLSPVQLDLNRRHAHEHGFANGVEAWLELDMCAMDGLDAEAFDAVVCYGGPLSYVFDRRDEAMRQMRRVLRPGGTLLASAMNLWGSVHEHLPAVLDLDAGFNAAVLQTGDLTPDDPTAHRCHIFRAEEFRALFEAHGFTVTTLSASNCLSAVWRDGLAEARQAPEKWAELIAMEIEACRQPGCLDMGTHVIAAGVKI